MVFPFFPTGTGAGSSYRSIPRLHQSTILNFDLRRRRPWARQKESSNAIVALLLMADHGWLSSLLNRLPLDAEAQQHAPPHLTLHRPTRPPHDSPSPSSAPPFDLRTTRQALGLKGPIVKALGTGPRRGRERAVEVRAADAAAGRAGERFRESGLHVVCVHATMQRGRESV